MSVKAITPLLLVLGLAVGVVLGGGQATAALMIVAAGVAGFASGRLSMRP